MLNIQQFEQYTLRRQLEKGLLVSYQQDNSIQEIVQTCKDKCIQQLDRKLKELEQLSREQFQQQQNEDEEIQPNYKQIHSYDDEESNNLKRAIDQMDSTKLWCNQNDLLKEEVVFPQYIIALYKKVIGLVIIDIFLITLICLFMPKFAMNIFNDKVTTDIKAQFIIYWISTIIFYGSIIFLFSQIKLFRLRLAVGTAALNILWHLLLIIINYSNQSSRQKLFPASSDAFYIIEFIVNIILFIVLLLFSARINAIVIGQNEKESQQELQQINGYQANEYVEYQNNKKINKLIDNGEAYAKSQLIKSQRISYNQLINDKISANSQNHNLSQNYKGDDLMNDQNNSSYMNDTICKLNETKNINFEETIYVNQHDIADVSSMNNINPEKGEQQDTQQKQNNQIFTITNHFQTEDNPTICHIEDKKKKKIAKPNQVYPLTNSDFLRKNEEKITPKKENLAISYMNDDQINQFKDSREKSISRIASNKIFAVIPQSTLYKKENPSQKSINTKNSTLYNQLDSTADKSLNLTNKQLQQISKIQYSQNFQSNKNNLNNNYLKNQYDMKYWGSQFCEYSPAIKIRRTIDKYNMEIPQSIEDLKMQQIEKQRQEQIKKQEKERVQRMQSAEIELQQHLSHLQLNQDELKRKYEKELVEKLKEKEEREKKLQQDLNNLKLESERKEREAKEKEIIEKERRQKEKVENERKEIERKENEKKENERKEKERKEIEKKQQEQMEKQRKEYEAKEQDRKQKELKEKERKEREVKEHEEKEKQKKNNEIQAKNNSGQTIDQIKTIQEEEEQSNSSIINSKNKTETSKQIHPLSKNNTNSQSKNKFKASNAYKINPSIIEEEEKFEKETNFIIFDDDFHDKENDQYIDINTFIKKNSGNLAQTHSLSQFPISVLKEQDDYNHVLGIEDSNQQKQLNLNNTNKDSTNQLENSQFKNSNKNEKTNSQNSKIDVKNINQQELKNDNNLTSTAKDKPNKDNSLKNNPIIQQKGNNRYSNFNSEDINKSESPFGIEDDTSEQLNKKHNVNINRLNQTVGFSSSQPSNQFGVFQPSSTQRLQSQCDTRKSENLQINRPNTSNNTPPPILNLNNFNRGSSNLRNNSIVPHASTYQSANRSGAYQNLDSHREMQRQSLIRQAENYLNNNFSGTGTPNIVRNGGGSSRMELIGQDDLNQTPETTQRDQSIFRILNNHKMRIIGVNDFDKDILKSIANPDNTPQDYTKSEYQKMKQLFSRGESTSKLHNHHLKQHGNVSTTQQITDDNQNLII